MTPSLRRLLALPRPLNPVERSQRDRALAHASALAPDTRQALAARGLPAPALRVGDPLLLAATGGAGSLWRLSPPGAPESVYLAEDSARAWRLAARLAAHSLPLVAEPTQLAVGSIPSVVPHSPPPSTAPHVRGESFGLAFFLAHLSRALAIPVPADVVASAALAEDGQLRRVDALREKLAAVSAWAPGVRRLLVAAEQADEARALPDHGLEVVGCVTVDDAWAVVFPEAELRAAIAAAWANEPVAERAARSLFRLALAHPPGNLKWNAVALAADVLVPLTQGGLAWRAAVASAIAWRHAGVAKALPPGPPPEDLPHPDRVALQAHRVQAANDGVAPDWRELADSAERDLPAPGHEHPDDLKLLGALGRLYAAWGELELARARLAAAADTWLALDRPDEASYPLTELIRVLGLLGDPAAVEARTVPPALLEGRGGAYIRLARGRAYVLCGDHARARAELEDRAADWQDAPIHVRASRLRWLVRAGGPADALPALARLAAKDPYGAGFAWCFARADAGDLAALAELAPDDARQLERCATVVATRGGAAADWFPY